MSVNTVILLPLVHLVMMNHTMCIHVCIRNALCEQLCNNVVMVVSCMVC